MSKIKQPGTFLHVAGPEGYHRWQVTVLGHRCVSGVSYDTAELAAMHCDTFKFYLRQVFRFDCHDPSVQPSMNPEAWPGLALCHYASLSNYLEIYRAFPQKVKEFIDKHKQELETIRDSRPDRTAWEIARYDPAFNDRPDLRDWGQKCERAEAQAKRFAKVNHPNFDAVVGGAVNSLGRAANALRAAVKLTDGKDDSDLDTRAKQLDGLRVKVSAIHAELAALAAAMTSQTNDVATKLDRLKKEKPAFYR